MTTRKWPVVGVLLAVLWLFVRGVALDPATILGEFLIGLAFGLPVAFAFRRFYAERTALGRHFRALPYAGIYVALFLKELLTANVDVAYRVLAPSMPLEPDVVVVPLRVETDAAITTIANSITLTPGTLTMDYDDETNTLYVHGITGRNREAILEPIRAWEDYALVIFDEERKPGDPVPEVPGVPRVGERADGGPEVDSDAGSDRPGDDSDGGGESDGE
ncbi:Na+/H+ antiporter subunit E [Halorussus gelatinilyticus]|uniref:Na+/H+ antiporter subunit E n=1 Tax=Halorussus gelatinilyticus TaxID=2937524 RepID=A0A8U0IET9_9EURY|nr:Na+/H+ antiporter subunit E [Halorussus gelatinilyticus]UPV99264.1 Na+/H+ antiporter subunit E [Halorussus gelatinilyticus]